MNSVEVPKGRPNCCLPCRDRHIKCITVGNAERCVNCISHEFSCIKEAIQFRHGDNPSVVPSRGNGKRQQEFADDQIWIKSSSRLVYIDETQELRTTYGHADGDAQEFAILAAPITKNYYAQDEPEAEVGRSIPPMSNDSPVRSTVALQSAASHARTNSSHASDTPDYTSRLAHASPEWNRSPLPGSLSGGGITPVSHPTLGPGTESTSRWSLQNAQEAYLMQHYVQVIGRFMDVLDPDEHFTLILPYRAANCPTLQQAIFALSARHLSRISDFDPYVSDEYSRRVMDEIFPFVTGSNAVNDVDLLCATVVLRLLEELDGFDNERQMKGVQVLMNAQINTAMTAGGLQQAAICIGLHQELTAALMAQRPIASFLQVGDAFDRTFAPADDRTWAFRIILHSMDILSFCYEKMQAENVQAEPHRSSSQQRERQAEWNQLMEYTKKWDALQPTHFKPMYEEGPPATSPFPLIYFHRPIHIMSAMHLHVCLILLSSHDPSLQAGYPQVGGGIQNLRRAAQTLKEVDERVRYHVRAICGIALCNNHLASAMIMSTAIVKLCGEHFIGEGLQREQKAILDLLSMNESKHGWPTQLVQNQLKKNWGLG